MASEAVPIRRRSGPGSSLSSVRERPVLLWTAATLLGVVLLLLLRMWTPSDTAGASICVFRHFGLTCPGCGMTRALSLLVQGDLAASFAMHPLAPLFAIEALALWSFSGMSLLRGRPWAPGWRVVNAGLIANGALLYAVWIVRFFS